MIITLLLAAGCGIGLWVLAVWLFPPKRSLAEQLEHSTAPPPAEAILLAGEGWATWIGRPFIAPLRAVGLPGEALTGDLAVIDRPISTHLAQKATLAVAGLLAPTLAHLLFAVAGVSLGVEVPVIAAVALAAVGFVLPDLQARRDAATLRTGFRHALSAYLDLVWITLAGGAGVDSALADSVGIGRGWAFAQIRRALETARMTRTTPWATLRQLGEELAVTELAELAASVSLAGTEGAKVRVSLAAKATALRTHQLTDAEGDAHAATERMSLPVMVLFLGFLGFITYPALIQVLNGI